MKASFKKHTFNFLFPAGTSRGILHTKDAWFLSITNEKTLLVGTGECSVIPALSPEFTSEEDYCEKLNELIGSLERINFSAFIEENSISFTTFGQSFLNELNEWPSIKFGLECALLDANQKGSGIIFDNPFSRGEISIPINGLVWMGNKKFMLKQIEHKITEGFKTIKLKIGAIDFDSELSLIRGIREKFSANEITIRVDANGAFDEFSVYKVLQELKRYDVHSIEQPVGQNERALLSVLAKENIVPIALDESLIACQTRSAKSQLLDEIKPQYIVLKPSLHGGLSGTQEWIQLAEERKLGWWITSALESSLGLAAIAQFTGNYPVNLPQGLGSGGVFSNNLPSNLVIANGQLTMQK